MSTDAGSSTGRTPVSATFARASGTATRFSPSATASGRPSTATCRWRPSTKWGELEGLLAFQIHSGPPQEVRFRDAKLTRDPVVELAGMDEAALEEALRPAPLLGFGGPRTAVDAPSGAAVESERSAASATALRRTPPGVEATLLRLRAPPGEPDEPRRRPPRPRLGHRRHELPEHGENDERPEGDRILILDDADGDGVADQAKVYYQGRDIGRPRSASRCSGARSS